MQFELTRVYRREEILSQPRNQKTYRNQTPAQENKQESPLVAKATLEQSVVALAKALKRLFKLDLHGDQRVSALTCCLGLRFMAAQQILGHGRHQRPGQQIRGQHGKH